MTDAPDTHQGSMPISRRGFAACSTSVALLLLSGAGFKVHAQAAPDRFFLTQEEDQALSILADRILPADDWPGATGAGVIDFIDFQLATGWGQGDGLFRQGPHLEALPQQGYQLPHTPAELFREALAHQEMRRLPTLAPAALDALLTRLQKNEVKLGPIPGGVFFTVLRQTVIEGYYSDPIHNGNRDLASWRMIGFPGAHAYYLTEVDRFDMDYRRPPSGVGHRPGAGEPPRLAPAAKANGVR